jgi:hypothetical protein
MVKSASQEVRIVIKQFVIGQAVGVVEAAVEGEVERVD